MTRRIFRSICFVALTVFLASVLLFLLVLYDYFGSVQKNGLRMQTELAAHAVANEGIRYFEGLESGEYRITWIDADGDVLYDNRSDAEEMENHLEREEIREARENGIGESARYSATLMDRALYCAKRLPDGSVIRLSVSQNTLPTLILGMAQPICIIFAIAIVLSMVLATRLSKKIVEPLNTLELENPRLNAEYEELSPLLRRLESLQNQIRSQEEALDRKQKEFDAVTENMTEGIVLLNTQGQILGLNRAAKRLFGVTAPCIGQSLCCLNDSAAVCALLRSAEAGRHDEKMADLADGRYQLIVSPVKSGDVPSGSVLLAIDVTEKEKAEQIRREFTANVSHELKTPLQTIAGSAELLANGLVREEDKAEFYNRIQNEAQRMIRLVEDIIHLSHLDEGAYDAKREKTDLYVLAQTVVRSLRVAAEKAQVTLTLAGESAVIEGIPQLLESIVFNLCDNAIQYNRADGRVLVEVRGRGDKVVLTVQDTGIGIPPEHQERIFERFYRVDKSRSKELGGTGLGLSIVKHAAGVHHAKIDLQSAVNEGTTITVTFPRACP